MYFGSGVAASRRGYHVLMFDGPGQGEMMYVQLVTMRGDWEAVVTKVVDFALALPNVDPRKIALSGWSTGGYLAPRGASGEPRLAALIADPGRWKIPPSAGWLVPTSEQITARRGRNIAIVAVARKLLTLVYYGARNGPLQFRSTSSAHGGSKRSLLIDVAKCG